MKISLLQLNINADNYWDKLISYLTTHDFDILHLQELTGKRTILGNINSKRDTFEELKAILSHKYNGELSIAQRYASGPESYMGNAIFYKKAFKLKEKKIIKLYDHPKPFPVDATSYEGVGRTLMHLKLERENETLSFLNTHFAWAETSYERPHQTKQGEIFMDYLQTVHAPFVLSGDFNINPQQPLIQKINQFAQNLISKNHITNTLNPRTHRAKELFPEGVAVDYIFVSPAIKVTHFSVIEEDVSDHFGLTAEIDI